MNLTDKDMRMLKLVACDAHEYLCERLVKDFPLHYSYEDLTNLNLGVYSLLNHALLSSRDMLKNTFGVDVAEMERLNDNAK